MLQTSLRLDLREIRQEILQLRAMELKHGRVAMLAVLGWFHVAAGHLGRSGTENKAKFFFCVVAAS